MNKENAIRKEVEVSPVTVGRIYKSEYQKEGTMTAELRQTIKTVSYYPEQVVVDSLRDNIFSTEDFSFAESTYENVENRVSWIDVPESATMESVAAKLATFEGANLYKILSNKPILSDRQQHAIDSPDIDADLDTFADSQATRFGEKHDNAGELVCDTNGKIQYRGVFFSATGKEDIDLRTADLADFYASEALHAELAGDSPVIENQSI